ncbi:hypothetical protein LDENG_00020020 [Lucifuga dentata]|nr:hypothetical protein LDENG_00020020 [Lucifuga dentata]
MSRGSDFRELRDKTFEDFEMEFEAKFDVKDKLCHSQQKQQPNPSVSVQNALKETLLDFQWDRPDITSPTKLSLRRRKENPAKARLSQEDANGRNALFVVSKCPHSRTELVDYLSLGNQDMNSNMAEYVVSRGLQDMLVQRQVVLYWMDSSSHDQVMRCEDHVGSEKLSEVLTHLGGRMIPVVSLLNLHRMTESFTFESSVGYLLSSERLYRQAFPVVEGVVRWGQGDVTQSCSVTVEPVSRRQTLLPEQVEVCLKGVLQGCDTTSLTETSTESWVLQCSDSSEQEAAAFQRLLMELSAHALHMFAEVNDGGLVCSAVLSVLSHSTALLTILQPGITQKTQLLTAEIIASASADTSADLPDVVNSVLGVVYDIMEEGDGADELLAGDQIPEWAQQELSHRSMTAGMVESWFPQSDQSGVSSNLMESMRLLHAVPEQREEEQLSGLQQELISGLAELYQISQGVKDKSGKKRGTHRTPVKQKMKTMSRSLQMLNVARLNVKAQKSQTETEQSGCEGSRGPDRPSKRQSGDRSKPGRSNAISFSSEAELLSHLKSSYEKTMAETDSSLLAGVQQLLSAVKSFLVAEPDLEVKTSVFVQQHLLKTSKSLRQSANVESKVRECQLQVMLRLELCRLFSSTQSDLLETDQMVEEVADMLRIISLTKDPLFLTRFLQTEILPRFLTAGPRVLADVYHSLGTQIPEALLAVLPSDFFSDVSVAKDSVSPSVSSPPLSTHSLLSDGGHHLQALRNRSASKRKSGMLTRHRSMSEASQSLRQIEMPKKTTRTSKPKVCIAVEKPVAEPPQPQKQAAHEVTKVRRNLFNQEMASPSKKSKLPRSQSVSAVEGRKRKRSNESDARHKLLTTKVSETPLHKQVSNRLLYRQRMGRRSVPTEECVVEESPVKPADLRRSPRIKKFARRHSTTFYSSSQPRSRNLDKAFSASQLPVSDHAISSVNLKTVRSPMRLLFGATQSPNRSSASLASCTTRSTRTRSSTDSNVFESPNKTPKKSPGKHRRASGTPRTPRTPKSPPSSKMRVLSDMESPVAGSSRGSGMALRGSPFRSPARRTLIVETPSKQSPMTSPRKGILKTPVKSLVECDSSSGIPFFRSPSSRTPKKIVTWSPCPQKSGPAESSLTFKVPESPCVASQRSPRLLRTPNKFSSPNSKTDIFKTPDRKSLKRHRCSPPETLMKLSENMDAATLTKESNQRSSERLHNKMNTPVKDVKGDMVVNLQETPLLQATPPPRDHLLSSEPNKTRTKSPSPSHQMATRSGRTPGKMSHVVAQREPVFVPESVTERSDTSLTSPKTPLRKTKSGQGARSRRRRNLRSQSTENVPSQFDTEASSAETCDFMGKNKQSDAHEEIKAETDSTSCTDSQQFDSSSTEDSSMDIVDAAVVKTQIRGGLKMNIRFSRKPSKPSKASLPNTESPKPCVPPQVASGRSYGFRQTPDRQQREAAARLGYSNDFPRLSTLRGSARPSHQKQKGRDTPNSLTYQVELDMQKSGPPKLKIRRTDSLNDSASDGGLQSGVQSLVLSPVVKLSQLESQSPLALFSKHRDAGCVSPSMCAHVTPAKSTPGKGGSIQTYICQAYTPTRHPAGTMSPLENAEVVPLTPSPQSAGKVTPENFNSWPRKKRAQNGGMAGKDRGLKAEPLLEELLEEVELGVSRLQDIEDTDELLSNKVAALALTSKLSPPVGPDASPLYPLEDLDWMETLTQQLHRAAPQEGEDDKSWAGENEDVTSTVTPPSSKVRKPVTASGILALTHSPLLFKGKMGSASKRTPQCKDEVEYSPFSRPARRSNTGRTYSRKRLLH